MGGIMKSVFNAEINEVLQAIHYRPAVSIILPFEPKMNSREEMERQLKCALKKVEDELKENYPEELSKLVMQKLKSVAGNLNFNTYKKSIAIYVSPLFEKVLYLDIPVEEKIIVNDSFEIRDIVYSKKELHKYLVLTLSGEMSKIYLGNTTHFIKVKFNSADNIAGYRNDVPERVANFSDPSHRKEVMLKKFLRHIDNGLTVLLQSYQLPVFVTGPKKVLGYFKAITKNEKNISEYIHGNYEDATEAELLKLLQPYVKDWKKVKLEDILHQIARAKDTGKLAFGITEVWKEATHKKGQFLAVEKNYMCAAAQGSDEDIIYEKPDPYSNSFYIKDAVDDVIEKVLENGGDVEFVDEGMLKEFNHIALIEYYS